MTDRLRGSHLALAALALALLARPAAASEKVFVLKNGRKIQGELISQSDLGYTVKIGGGQTTLPRGLVLRVEDAPARPSTTVEPDAARHEAPGPVKSATVPAAPAPSNGSGAPAAPLPPPRVPLASPAEIARVRAALASALGDADPATARAREEALEKVRKEATLASLVGVLATPSPPGTGAAERALALEIVAGAGASARPFYLQAIGELDPARPPPPELFSGLRRIGPDGDGAVELALTKKVEEAVAGGKAPDELLRPLEYHGTRRSLARLFDLLLASENADCATRLGRVCLTIVKSDDEDTDAALQPLLPKLDGKKLPDAHRLASALSVLGGSHGLAVSKISEVLGLLERDQSASTPAVAECLRQGYLALASIGTGAAREQLLAKLEAAPTRERRLAVLEAVAHLLPSTAEGGLALDMALIARLEQAGEDADELAALVAALRASTGRALGPSPSAWRAYVQSLQR